MPFIRERVGDTSSTPQRGVISTGINAGGAIVGSQDKDDPITMLAVKVDTGVRLVYQENSAKVSGSLSPSTSGTIWQSSTPDFVPSNFQSDFSEESSLEPQRQTSYAIVETPEKSICHPSTWFEKPSLVPVSNDVVSAMTSLQRNIVVLDRYILRKQPLYTKNYIEYKVRLPRVVQLNYESTTTQATNDHNSGELQEARPSDVESKVEVVDDVSTLSTGDPTSRQLVLLLDDKVVLMVGDKVLHTITIDASEASEWSAIRQNLVRMQDSVDNLSTQSIKQVEASDDDDDEFSVDELSLLAKLYCEINIRFMLPPQQAEQTLQKIEALELELSKEQLQKIEALALELSKEQSESEN